jgi:uncharacterized RDD family membrane protein YckC
LTAAAAAPGSGPDAHTPAAEIVAGLLAANPFPGLRSFEPDEGDRFFGRRQQIDALVMRLAQVPLVAVYGASGCGKSSLVKAGLLRELDQRHRWQQATDWRPVVMRPGSRPIAHLAAALAAALADPAGTEAMAAADPDELSPLERRTASLQGQLRQGGLALVEIMRRARLPDGARLLVVVDQFEEIFRMKRLADAEEAGAFVKLLLQSAFEPASRISVILTLRSDTLGGCADFEGLPEAVSAGGYLVPRLTRAQRKEAIVGPVQLRGHDIAPRLVQKLLGDVSADFDDLPVMQHALSRTWAHWAQSEGGVRPLDLKDYDFVGGATQALSRHADEAWADLEPAKAPGGTVERVFRALTERVSGGIELRRPVELRELLAICDDGSPQASATVRRVVDRYRRADTAFLVPAGDGALAADAVIDISHESLIRQWVSLRVWLDREAESKRIYERLAATAAEHAKGQARLWRQPDLGLALAWRDAQRPNEVWARRYAGDYAGGFAQAMDFLDDSHEEEVAGQTQRRRRLRGWISAGIVCFALLLSSLLSWVIRDYGSVASRDRSSRATLENFMFFDQLLAAAEALTAHKGDAWTTACDKARKLADGQDWRERQRKAICDPAVDKVGPDEFDRLRANVHIGKGEVEEAVKLMRDLRGDIAVRLYVNLQSMADLDVSEMQDDRMKLTMLARCTGYGSAEPGKDPKACAGCAAPALAHPVHTAIAQRLCSRSEPDADTKPPWQHLLDLYIGEADAAQRWLNWRSGAGSEQSNSPLRAQERPRAGLNDLTWLYWQVAKNASRPATMLDRLKGQLRDASNLWVEAMLMLVPVAWWAWRRLRPRLRPGKPVPSRPWPLRRSAAALTDCLVAAGVLALGIYMTSQIIDTLNLGKIDMPMPVQYGLAVLLAAPGLAYLLFADAINLRHERSFGKLLFGLRPVRDEGPEAGHIGLRLSAKRNLLLLLPFLVVLVSVIAAIGGEFGGMRFMLALLLALMTVWFWLLRHRSVGDRWSRTHVIDADSLESRAIDTPPRYRRAAPPDPAVLQVLPGASAAAR